MAVRLLVCCGLFFSVSCIGCRSGDPTDSLSVLEHEDVHSLLCDCTVSIEHEGEFICIGAIVARFENEFYVLSANDSLPHDIGYQVVFMERERDKQRYLVERFNQIEVFQRFPAQGVVALRVAEKLPNASRIEIPLQREMTRKTNFEAWSVKADPLTPITPSKVSVLSRRFTGAENGPYTSYWRLEHEMSPQILGSPLIDQHGRLIGIACRQFPGVGHYCDDREVRKIVDSVLANCNIARQR